jgi:ADP-heptose:LPS heptosyltransferase
MRNSWKQPLVYLNIINTAGGLGDLIARLPAFKYLNEAYPHISATVWSQDYFVELGKYLLPENERLFHAPLSAARFMMSKPIVEFDMERLTTLQLHLTDHAFLILLDQLPPTKESRYYPAAPAVLFQHKYRPPGHDLDPDSWGKYIVFTVGYTSATRKWPAFHINDLAKRCAKRGLTPVLMGTTQKLDVGMTGDFIKAGVDEEINRGLFVDLVDRTTLIECLGIMQRSRAVIGVDNGLLHLAHCTDVPIVAGFTTLNPVHRVPYRRLPTFTPGSNAQRQIPYPKDLMEYMGGHGLTEVVAATVPCINSKPHCQSEGFAINQDWRKCVYGDYACTLEMSASQFETALKKLNVLT